MKNILLIDDDEKTTSFLVEYLRETCGYAVDNVVEAGEVIARLKENKYDAIILDMMMPVPASWTVDEKKEAQFGLNTGGILFRQIRKLNSNVPILVLTARESSLIDKNTSHLRKPEAIRNIVLQLKKVMLEEK